jgi:N-acetylglucosamine-6-phosphate deacetylase
MMKLALEAGQLLTSDACVPCGRVLVEDGKILACGSRDSFELPAGLVPHTYPEGILAPGFIDLHIHGAAGHDTMTPNLDGLRAMACFLARRGVTSFLPTTFTAPLDEMLTALRFLSKHCGKALNCGKQTAVALGIHLEGPFLNPARRGIHPPIHLQEPSTRIFDKLWEASHHKMRLLTIAPEVAGAVLVIKCARQVGVRVSIGHSNATLEEAQKAIDAGATHATHTFNAMRRMEHRDPGVAGAVLVDDRVTADIIADGFHVQPAVLQLFLRSKGRDRAVLVTDAVSATGLPEGTYRIGDFAVEVHGLQCESYGKLAGSVLTLDHAVRNVMQIAHWSLADAVRLATLNPARVLGIEKQKGSLHPGADADLNILTQQGEVVQTFIAGEPL